MTKFIFIISSLLSLMAISGCNQRIQEQEGARLYAMSIEDFKQGITIEDDDFETSAKFSTRQSFTQKHGILGLEWSDSFLRGYIDKKSGNMSYQVYVALKTQERSWFQPYQANYGKPLRSKDAKKVHSDVDCTGSKYNGCTYYEHAVFTLDQDEMDRIQSSTDKEMETLFWGFKLKGKSGRSYMDGFSLKEIIALTETMDGYTYTPMR